MAAQDKSLLMARVEDTLKPRMFANLLEEAVCQPRPASPTSTRTGSGGP